MPKKNSIWTSTESRYGTYEGERGNPRQWSESFNAAFEGSGAVKTIVSTSHYATLGVRPDASEDEIRSAYRKLAKRLHPDKHGNDVEFNRVTEAYTAARSQARIRALRPTSSIIPQLLTPIEEDEVEQYLTDDAFGAQEKKDGRHLTLQVVNGAFFVRNKKGQVSTCAPEFDGDLRSLGRDILIDGEQIGDTFWAWDLLEIDGSSVRHLPYYVPGGSQSRYSILANIDFGPSIKVLELAVTAREKRAMMAELKRTGKEGIVFKRLSAAFSPGKGIDQLKFKFYAEASVIVAPGRPGKMSIGMELIGPDGNRVFVGYCSCSSNPPIGSVVEIKYLYAYRGGCLYQSSFKESRDDVDVEECTTSQLKYKQQ